MHKSIYLRIQCSCSKHLSILTSINIKVCCTASETHQDDKAIVAVSLVPLFRHYKGEDSQTSLLGEPQSGNRRFMVASLCQASVTFRATQSLITKENMHNHELYSARDTVFMLE